MQETFPEVPSHSAVTRRLQFGLKDDKQEEKAEKKKNRKRKANTASEKDAKTTHDKKSKRKNKGKAKVSSKKVKAKECKPKAKALANLSKLRKARSKSISPKKEVPVERETPCESPEPSERVEEPQKTTAGTEEVKVNQGEEFVWPQQDIDAYKQTIEKAIATCCDNDCEHSWEATDFSAGDQYQFSTYWSRDAVGLKVSNELLPSKKTKTDKPETSEKTKRKTPKSKNFSQVAYFGSSGCIYTNMVLAHTLAL